MNYPAASSGVSLGNCRSCKRWRIAHNAPMGGVIDPERLNKMAQLNTCVGMIEHQSTGLSFLDSN